MAGQTVGVGIVGAGFMARVHAAAVAACRQTMPGLGASAELVAYCGRPETPASALPAWPELADAAPVQGWEALVSTPGVDLVCICSGNRSHAEIACAALRAGKHLLCEKPLADSLAAARAMAAAAREAPGQAAVSFNYRRVPAVALARAMIESGEIGVPARARFAYLQDWGLEESLAGGWRFDPVEAGGGVLQDLGSHTVDLARYLLGESPAAVAATVAAHPVAEPAAAAAEPAAVLDAAATVLARFPSGLTATFELSRVAPGNRNGLRFEIDGSEGSIRFSLERLNELELAQGRSRGETYTRLFVTEADHPWMAGRRPPGHPIGWEDTFAFQAHDLLACLAEGREFVPSFRDGLAVQSVLAAAYAAAAAGRWQEVEAT
jgi:predicted dehydrogenase